MCTRGRQEEDRETLRLLEELAVGNVGEIVVTSTVVDLGDDSADLRPTDEVVAVLVNPVSKRREARRLKWGLWPTWMRERPKRPLVNAKAETVAELPAFREAFAQRRCVVPMSVFFEFDAVAKYAFGLAGHETMPLAGIWESRQDENGRRYNSCAIVTTEPNELVAEVHNRMPVILTPEGIETWLAPTSSPAELRSLLIPYEPALMERQMVRKRPEKRSRRSDDPGPGLFDE